MGLLLDRAILAILTFVLLFASMYMSIDNFFEASYQWRTSFRTADRPHREWFLWLASVSLTIAVVTNHWLNPIHPDANTTALSVLDILAILGGLALTYLTVRIAVAMAHSLSPLVTGATLTMAILVIHYGAESNLDSTWRLQQHLVTLPVYTLLLYGCVTLTQWILKLTRVSSTTRSLSATIILSLSMVIYHDLTSVKTRQIIQQTVTSKSLALWIQDVHLSAVAQLISTVAILLILLNALVNRYLHRRQRAMAENIFDILTRNQGLVFMLVPHDDSFVVTVCEGDVLYKLGLSHEEFLNKPLEEAFGPKEETKAWLDYCRNAFSGEEVVFESEIRGIPFLTSMRPVIRNHKTIAVVGSSIETSSLQRTRQILSDVGQRYRLIVDNTSDLILVLSRSGRVQFASPSSQTLIGRSYRELRGQLIAPLVPESDRLRTVVQFREMRSSWKPMTVEHRLIHKDGTPRVFESRCVPIYDDGHQLDSVIVVGRDISERKRNEEMLRRSENLSVLGQLAAGMAHEIRNPLTSIRGFIQLLEETQNENPYWPIILNETQQIENIVSEFLSLSKPQAEERTILDLCPVLGDVQMLVSPLAILKNARVELNLAEPTFIKGVPHQLKQVFTNVIKNALEALDSSGDGLVLVSLRKTSDNAIVTITDNGPGIDPEILERLGEPFYSTKSKGTGLGLLISNKIVQEHGGLLNVSSTVGTGTEVFIQFPVLIDSR